MKTKINLTYSSFALRRYWVKSVIKACVLETLRIENVPVGCEINVLITDDANVRTINAATRNIDKATDVLSFPMFSFEQGKLPEDWSDYIDPESGLCPLGDMAISVERALTQANEFGHTLRREVGYLTIHSMLHLLGYDHLDEGAQKRRMREREELIVSSLKGMQR